MLWSSSGKIRVLVVRQGFGVAMVLATGSVEVSIEDHDISTGDAVLLPTFRSVSESEMDAQMAIGANRFEPWINGPDGGEVKADTVVLRDKAVGNQRFYARLEEAERIAGLVRDGSETAKEYTKLEGVVKRLGELRFKLDSVGLILAEAIELARCVRVIFGEQE